MTTDETVEDLGLLPTTRRALRHRIARAQNESRVPSLVAGVARDGEVIWEGALSALDGVETDGRTQYRVGSISKTFTAVLVMRLRDEGLLELTDPLEKHLPGTGAGQATIADLLSHTAGLAAEAPGEWWERSPGTLRPELSDVLGEEPHRHPVGRIHHYSNPGYTLLGALVEEMRGEPWEKVLRTEVLEPLGLTRTSYGPQAPYARGWAVHPWADALLPEPAHDLGRMAPAGQLWSTTRDLLRFAAFLLDGDEEVLSAASVREMRTPAAPSLPGTPESAYGLGLQVLSGAGATLTGHMGSLPGYLAALLSHEGERLTAVVLANTTSGLLVGTLAAELLGIVAEAEPAMPRLWRPMREVDPAVLELAGAWYWGVTPYGLHCGADGGVELRPLKGTGRASRFEAVGDGTWRGLDGYFRGEILRPVRDAEGAVTHLDLGAFVYTREPYAPDSVVPGGVDARGWHGQVESG
ncbi:serine hydrolase domain-containing protein [Streptomyces sp. BRB081]|uniref:serine hydrolase domain-containing protein n=1 Tax=Streptomyces TaxID=1883 RepID=UPI0018ACEA58|nr:serine hydrolase domain-containing protein [Streptomyces sp. BRB081]MBL3805645.1 beta-lactamase family protein [Streptomyces sp. BRB081]